MRALTVCSLVALLALAGCAGQLGGTNPTETVTPVDPPETTADPPAGVSEDNTVTFADLTEYQQEAFEQARLDGSAQFVPNTSHIDESEGFRQDQMTPFEENEFVRYEGQYYRIEIGDGDLFASYGIRTSPGTPGENDSVVAIADLPASLREEARTAVTEGSYHAPFGKWDSLPEPLRDADYLRYENETYRVGYVVGDNWAPEMTVEPVD